MWERSFWIVALAYRSGCDFVTHVRLRSFQRFREVPSSWYTFPRCDCNDCPWNTRTWTDRLPGWSPSVCSGHCGIDSMRPRGGWFGIEFLLAFDSPIPICRNSQAIVHASCFCLCNWSAILSRVDYSACVWMIWPSDSLDPARRINMFARSTNGRAPYCRLFARWSRKLRTRGTIRQALSSVLLSNQHNHFI